MITGDRLWHGGDYSPEQWTPEVWDADERLMDEAGWNVATVGVFSWVSLEPSEGKYQFDWLDETFERLHRRGRNVILATPSAAPPAWMAKAYPEILRVGPDGVRRRQGNRVNTCLTSPIYREKTRQMAEQLARRYGSHPALALWHVSNEFAGPCHCDLCAEAFRTWLRARYEGDLDALNRAWWSSFWGHTYTDWEQVEIPGPPLGETSIQGQSLDWRRYDSDQARSFLLNEMEPLRRLTPSIPVTTNFMGFFGGLDYSKVAPDLDVTSWDSYPLFTGSPDDPATWAKVGLTHDLCRSLNQGRPFLLMECTPSASNWYEAMELKRPGMLRFEGLQAVAHGSDSVQYFQWRQSRGSQEQFHGAVVAHDGSNRSRVFQEVASLGQELRGLEAVAGSSAQNDVALYHDWENTWAIELACGPKQGDRGYQATLAAHHRSLWEAGIGVDVALPTTDLTRYRLVIAPMLMMVSSETAAKFEAYVQQGGTLVATYWSGIVDEHGLAHLGGFPGPLRSLLGVWDEELDVLPEGRTVRIVSEPGNGLNLRGQWEASTFCSRIHAESAEVLARYGDEFYAGSPAVTCNRFGSGRAIYVASRNDQSFTDALLRNLLTELGVQPILADLPQGVTALRRTQGDREYIFVLNANAARAEVALPDGLRVLGSDQPVECLALAPHDVLVLERSAVSVAV